MNRDLDTRWTARPLIDQVAARLAFDIEKGTWQEQRELLISEDIISDSVAPSVIEHEANNQTEVVTLTNSPRKVMMSSL